MKKLFLLFLMITFSLKSWEISIFYSQAGTPYKCNLNDRYLENLEKDLTDDLQGICEHYKVEKDAADIWESRTIAILQKELFKQKEIYIGYLKDKLEKHCNQFPMCKPYYQVWTIDILESLCYRLFGRCSIATEQYIEPYEEEKYEKPVPVKKEGKERILLDTDDEDDESFLKYETKAHDSCYSSLASTDV